MMPETTTSSSDHRLLIILLRVVGGLSCTAVIASVMPTTWIAATHSWLGLGEFPDAPIAEYLARSLSAFYAMFGALTIVVSMDVVRYALVIRVLAWLTMAFGALITGIDALAGMPGYWTLLEGPSTVALGLAILLLVRRVRPRQAGMSD